MTTSTITAAPDKRTAILNATCDLIAEKGLHNTPMSAIARKANVAAGTLYLYFQNKEILINEVFLHLKEVCLQYVNEQVGPVESLDERFRQRWFAFAQWHLDCPQAFNFIQQCEVSGILTQDTLQRQEILEGPLLAEFQEAVEKGFLRDVPRQIVYALMMGPILILAHLQAKGEIVVTESILEQTYLGVQQGLML